MTNFKHLIFLIWIKVLTLWVRRLAVIVSPNTKIENKIFWTCLWKKKKGSCLWKKSFTLSNCVAITQKFAPKKFSNFIWKLKHCFCNNIYIYICYNKTFWLLYLPWKEPPPPSVKYVLFLHNFDKGFVFLEQVFVCIVQWWDLFNKFGQNIFNTNLACKYKVF